MIKSFIKLVALGAFLMLLITPQVFAMGAGGAEVEAGRVLAAQEQVLAAQILLPVHILIRSHFTPTAWGRRKRSTRARRLTSNDRFDFKVALPIQLGAAGATAATGGNRLAPHKIK